MHKLYRQRTSNRYGKIGTFSNNQGYLAVSRDFYTGRFTSKNIKTCNLKESMLCNMVWCRPYVKALNCTTFYLIKR